MKKKSVLVATYLTPWPLRANGVSIRLYPLLEHLAEHCDIDVVVFAAQGARPEPDPILKRLRRAAVHETPRRRPSLLERAKMAVDLASPWGPPREYASYHIPDVRERLQEFVGSEQYDVLLWIGYYHWQAIDAVRSSCQRVVYDSMDSPSLHYERSPKRAGLAQLLKPYDLWKCRRWERSLAKVADATVYVSPIDAAVAGDPAMVIPNGVYPPQDAPGPVRQGPCIGFLGHMGYSPNIIGAKNLHDNVFRPLKKSFPNLRLKIIGRNPAPEIVALRAPDVEVTGTVEDIWEHIRSVDVFVFPMSSGAGLQNKILEAMVAGKPVVTTSVCTGSVGARIGSEILRADTPEGLQDAVASLLFIPEHAAHIGERGRQYVLRAFNPETTLSLFERVLFGDPHQKPSLVDDASQLGVKPLPLS